MICFCPIKTNTDILPVLQSFAGKDATKKFNKHHNPKLLERYKGELKVGEVIEDEDKDAKLISKMKLKFFKGKS